MPNSGMTLERLQVIVEAITKPYKDAMNEVQQKTTQTTQHVEKQTSRIKNALKKIGAVVAVVFSVAAIVNFGKSCVQLGSDLAEVQNVVDVTFGSMSSSVNAFANDAIEQFGLSETMAKKYMGTYGAMAKAFGFGIQQTYDMSAAITGLTGDVASFYNLSTDEAYTKLKSIFTGETESLKDLGVVMTQTALDQYALNNGFGRTTAKMTEQEKVMLRYQFVMSQLSDASGDFARTSGGWANQVRVLSLRFDQLKATIGQGLINALTPVIRVINAVIARLQVFAEYFRALTAALFGNNGSSGGSMSNAADAAGSIASSMGSAAGASKELKRNLMGFDQINRISDNSAASGSSGGEIGGIGSLDFGSGNKIDFSNIIDTSAVDEVLKKIQPLTSAMSHLWEALKPFASSIGKGLLKFLGDFLGFAIDVGNYIIAPILNAIADAIEDISPEQAEDIGYGLGILAAGLLAIKAAGSGVAFIGTLASFLGSISAFVSAGGWGPVFDVIGNEIADKFDEAIRKILPEKVVETLSHAIGDGIVGAGIGFSFAGPIGALVGFLVGAFIGALTEAFDIDWGKIWDDIVNNFFNFDYANTWFDKMKADFDAAFKAETWWEIGGNILMGIADGITGALAFLFEPIYDFFTWVWDKICELFGIHSPAKNMEPLGKNIILGIAAGFEKAFSFWWDLLKSWGTDTLNFLGSKIPGFEKVFKGLTDFISGVFSGDWRKAWTGVKNIFGGIMDGLGALIKAPLNGVIGLVNGVIGGLNKIKIPDWDFLGDLAGKGFNIPKINYLAKGGVVASPTMAMIGEAGKEAVIPLERNTGWMDKVAQRVSLYSNNGVTKQELMDVMVYVFNKYMHFYIGDQDIARHAQKGQAEIGRRYSPQGT